MGYVTKIEESKQKVYNQSVATRILDLVDKLRLNSNENDQRRWVWELIQNAKDVAFDNQPVSIAIDLLEEHDKSICFRHNGKPFSIDNITFLIEQVSTKERSFQPGVNPKTTGKFGTGFLTTHLLAEKVEVEGVVKEPNLPYKKFCLLLNRSGTEIDEIIRSVDDSIDVLKKLDDAEEFLSYNKNDLNSNFRYLLDEEGILTAKKGIEDLELCLAYTLAFVPNINSICINAQTTYTIQPQEIIEDDEIVIRTIQKDGVDGYQEETHIAIVSNERISVAVEIVRNNNQISIVEPNEKLPRLFCDFPLIGSEDFNFPVVINSSFFNPTEPRNGIYLTDKNDNKIIENKDLLTLAKSLYLKLLNYSTIHNWKNVWVLAKISNPKAKEWISIKWYSENILDPIRGKLLTIPLVDTVLYGRIPIECGEHNNLPKGASVDFPKHSKKSILIKIWNLCNNAYFIIPEENDYQQWSEIIWDKKYQVGIERITQLIETKENINRLSDSLQKDISETKKWLNDFYYLLEEEGEFIKDTTDRSIYLNQNGLFRRKNDLLFEKERISETLKDISKDLGSDFREKLLDLDADIKAAPNVLCDSSIIANEITKLIRPRLGEIQRTPETKSLFKKLYLWFNQYPEQADEIFDFLYKNKHKLLDDEEIVSSIKKAELLDSLLLLDTKLSAERILELLELEELSKGFATDNTYTPTEEQKRKNFINGWKGEAFVYKALLMKGLNVVWANKSTTATKNQIVDFEGETIFIDDKMDKYDLEIILPNNSKSFIQVKSTTTNITRADEIAMPISVREWNFINEKSASDTYYLARVFDVSSSTPDVYFMKVDKIETI